SQPEAAQVAAHRPRTSPTQPTIPPHTTNEPAGRCPETPPHLTRKIASCVAPAPAGARRCAPQPGFLLRCCRHARSADWTLHERPDAELGARATGTGVRPGSRRTVRIRSLSPAAA